MKLGLAPLWSALVLWLLATPSFAKHHTLTAGCENIFELVEQSTSDDWQPPGNIFGKTLPYMIPTAVAALTLSQVIKHSLLGDPQAPVFSEAFPLTVAIDTALTLTSHWIATSRLDRLKAFLEGRRRDGQVGFWQRAGANAVLGTAIITLGWLGSAIDVGLPQFCGAAGLCAVVYPTLQATKTHLYRRLPQRRDVGFLAELAQGFPTQSAELRRVAAARAHALDISPQESELLMLTAIEAVVTNVPLEDHFPQNLLPAGVAPLQEKIRSLNRQISALGPAATSKDHENFPQFKNLIGQQRTARRTLLNHILLVHAHADDAVKAEIEAHLSLGEEIDPGFSMAVHNALAKRSQGQQWRLVAASLADVSLAIGFFGGVCLEATNSWAQTGDVPPVLQHLLAFIGI